MIDFAPLREILPVVRPKAADEQLHQWVERYYDPSRREQPSKIWFDHFASVADYWDHKRRHPDSHAGVMVVLYSWTPCVLAIAGVVTINPMVVIPAMLDPRKRGQKNRFRSFMAASISGRGSGRES